MLNLTLHRVGGKLTNCEDASQTFTICERRKTTPSKASLFLLQKRPAEKYVSSLWPADASGNVFEFETDGIRYTLTLESSKAFIRPRGANGNV